jgi:transposase-like protein
MKETELNLASLAKVFADEDLAREFLEKKRWPNGPRCPRCGSTKAYALTARPGSKKPVRKGVYCCAKCRRQFTVRIGTIFEDSHIPLRKWLMAFHLMSSSKKGISSMQLHRELGITLKSAWFLSHRIRESMDEKHDGQLFGIVEVDETYVGGKVKGGHDGRTTAVKTPALALVERNGRVRSRPVERVNAATLKGAILENVHRDAAIMTDDFASYRGIGRFFRYHKVVRHTDGEYSRGDVTTNTVESFFAILKRGHYGIFHSLSKHHLHRYCSEFSFRWNYRKVGDGERMLAALRGAEGKRLMYRQSIN